MNKALSSHRMQGRRCAYSHRHHLLSSSSSPRCPSGTARSSSHQLARGSSALTSRNHALSAGQGKKTPSTLPEYTAPCISSVLQHKDVFFFF